jgi:hypothetical protein
MAAIIGRPRQGGDGVQVPATDRQLAHDDGVGLDAP